MAKVTEKHKVSEEILLYMQSDLRNWMARFKVDDRWYQKTTKETDVAKATIKAIQLQAEYKVSVSNHIPVHTTKRAKSRQFGELARKSINYMEQLNEAGKGKPTFVKYISALERIHIPYFDKIAIEDIDRKMLSIFDEWRLEEMGKQPSKSTINTHNAAMKRVFEQAVIEGYIRDEETPILKNTGVSGERRGSFTKDEYETLVTESIESSKNCRKQITSDIRTLLHYYIQFGVLTGIRPGTEIEFLTWRDIHKKTDNNGNDYISITVRKGKTTKHTGTREIVARHEVKQLLEDLRAIQQHTDKDDLIFTLPNGDKTEQLTVAFRKMLDKFKMRRDAHGNRTLYSLRHTYITWRLQEGTSMEIIANQCGTSVEMIQQHYSHITPTMFAEELSGKKKKSTLKVMGMSL